MRGKMCISYVLNSSRYNKFAVQFTVFELKVNKYIPEEKDEQSISIFMSLLSISILETLTNLPCKSKTLILPLLPFKFMILT